MRFEERQLVLVSLSTSNPQTVDRLKATYPKAQHVQAATVDDIARLYRQYHAMVGVCAAGILVRAVANDIKPKKQTAPLLALADDASCIIPLLGGHQGGNALARDIAHKLGAFAAISTASDLALGFDFEAPPDPFVLVGDHKSFVARALKGEAIKVVNRLPHLPAAMKAFLARVPNQDPNGTLHLNLDHLPATQGLSYIPKTTAVGLGASRSCSPEELQKLVDACLQTARRHPASVYAVGSHQLKSDEKAVLETARSFDVRPAFFNSDILNKHKPKLSRVSEIVFKETGCWGVAEAAALELVGGDELLLPKQKSIASKGQAAPMATCALAERKLDL